MTRGAARLAGLLAAAMTVAALLPGHAAEPRSAIPWLSQSIEIEDTPPPPSRSKSGRVQPGADAITVTPLGDIRRDAVGLLPPERTGFARALWGTGSAAEVRDLILAHPDQGVPETRALFHRLLLAEADPPPGAGSGDSVLVARIDRLLGIGALEEAGALIDRAGPETPELFRRWFDVGLLLEQSTEPCAALRQNPSLSPTLPARVFCLARGGDWNAAEITLTLGQGVGSIPEAEQALLARFLDPELFEEEPEPPMPDPLTALDFLMREAVGLSRPPGPLPLAFLHPDLDPHAPMRSRIEAAERLVLSGAVAYPEVFAAYRSGVPAASGGIWDRALAVQALDAGLEAERSAGARRPAAGGRRSPFGARPAGRVRPRLRRTARAARPGGAFRRGPDRPRRAPAPRRRARRRPPRRRTRAGRPFRGTPRHRRRRPAARRRRGRASERGAGRARRRDPRRRPRGTARRTRGRRAAGPGDPRGARPAAARLRGRSARRSAPRS